jgi:hypothetical protein
MMDNCCQTLFNLGIEHQQISKWSVAIWCSEPVAKWLREHKNMAGFTFTEAQTPDMWYIVDFEGCSNHLFNDPKFMAVMKRLASA